MTDLAKIKTLRDNTTGETVAPRTVVKALSGEGTVGQLVGYTENNVVGNITPDAEPTEGSTNPVQSGGVYDATKWHSNQNLLDNWYFLNPINQRGQMEYTGAGYSIDRWRIWNNTTTLALNDDGIIISNIENPNNGLIFTQPFESFRLIPGETYTFSLLVDVLEINTGGVAISMGQPSGWIGGIHSETFTLGKQLLYVTFIRDKEDTNVIINFGVNLHNGKAKLIAAKLEIGDHQTLAHKEGDTWVLNEIPNYGEELAKCQRYQLVFGPSTFIALGMSYLTDTIEFGIPISRLRKVPSITQIDTTSVFANGRIFGDLTNIKYICKDCFRGDCKGAVQDSTYIIETYSGGYVIFDANL